MNIQEKLNLISSLEEEILEKLGFIKQWRDYKLRDRTEEYWRIENNSVVTAANKVALQSGLADMGFWDGDFYEVSEDYCQDQIINDLIFRIEDYTAIAVDTQMDRNSYLDIFDNQKELKTDEEIN